jgi:hypothetical protein
MIFYIIFVLIILALVDHFSTKQIYQFSFVTFSLTSPFSLFIPRVSSFELFNSWKDDQYIFLTIFFLLGLNLLYCLVSHGDTDSKRDKIIVLSSSLFLINSFELKAAVLLWSSIFIWFRIRKLVVGLDVNFILILILLFMLKSNVIPFNNYLCLFILLMLVVFQLLNNKGLLGYMILLLASSSTGHLFVNQTGQRIVFLGLIVFLSLGLFFDLKVMRRASHIINRYKIFKRVILRIKLVRSVEFKIISLKELSPLVSKINRPVKFLDHKNDILPGVVCALGLIILGALLV